MPEELVHIDGDIKTAKIAHRLHNPSFTSTKARNGACADTTSPCTALVMVNAYNGNSILFDHCSRREVVDPFVYYTKDILACHEGYLTQIRNNMHAPVEIVYGIPTWERTQHLLQDKLQTLDLWGTYEGITIYLEWEIVQENLNETPRGLRRFLISAFHPQNMIRAWSKSYAAGQDRFLEIRYRLAGIDFIERFYETEVWRKQVKFLLYAHFSVNQAIRNESIKALQNLHSQRLNHENSKLDAETQKRLRNLAFSLKRENRERIEAFRSDGSSVHVYGGPMPSSLTKEILLTRGSKCTFSYFLKDKKDVVDLPFEVECTCIVCLGNSKYGKNDCTVVVDQQPRWTKTTPPKYVERLLSCNNCGKFRRFLPINAELESLSLTTITKFHRGYQGLSGGGQLLMLQKIPSAARNHRWQMPNGQKRRTNKVNQYRDLMPKYLETREGWTVCTTCSLCGRQEIDMEPQWLTGTDKYYARETRVCSTVGCNTDRRNMIPMDKSMNYIKHRYLIDRMRKDIKLR